MDMEKRVKMLEQEVQILKNEIQATLLDIQSHLLTNAHTNLRTVDHGYDDHDSLANPANITAFKLPNNAALPEDDESDEPPTIPSVRRVNLGDLANNHEQSQPGFSNSQPPQLAQSKRPQNNHSEFTSQDDYEAWVKTKLNELGFQRTRELILLYQDTGRFDYDTSEMLLRLIMLYAPRPNHAGASKPHPQNSNHSTPSKPARSSSPPQSTTKRKKSRTRKASNRSQQERRPAPPQERIAQRNRRSTAKVTEPKTVKPPKEMDSEDDEGRGVVLKLIAGVQSAGIGLKKGLTGSNG